VSCQARYLNPCTLQKQHGGTTICGWQPTPARTHHYPGSVSSALRGASQPDTSPQVHSQLPQLSPCKSLCQVIRVRCYIDHLHSRSLFPLQAG
jgi:hypothetical protein